MFSCVLAALAMSSPSAHINLQPVEDTTLDSQMPELNLGHDGFLIGGPKYAILLRFPGLAWLPGNEIPDTAVLNLHLSEATDVKLASVSRVLVPWAEGAGTRLPMTQTNNDSVLAGTATWTSSRYGQSKWSTPGGASDKDCSPISGVKAVVEGDTVHITGLATALAAMAQNPSQNFGIKLEFGAPVSFFSSEGQGKGPSLEFTTKVAPAPVLAVTSIEPGDSGAWVATVKNLSSSPVTGWHATWTYRNVQVGESSSQQALAPGDTVRVSVTSVIKAENVQPRRNLLTVKVDGGGQGTAFAERTVPVNGLPVRFDLNKDASAAVDKLRGEEPLELYLQKVIACANDAVLGQSKSSFAPDGCWERLRLTTSTEPAVVVTGDLSLKGVDITFESVVREVVRAISPLQGKWAVAPDTISFGDVSVGWIGDTRDETLWPSTLMLPQFPWGEPKQFQAQLPVLGLLSRAESAALNSLAGKPFTDRATFVPRTSKVMIVVVTDGGGAPIGNADVDVFRTVNGVLSTEPEYKVKSSSNGYVILGESAGKAPFSDLKPDGSNSWYFLRVTKDFITESAWVSAANVSAEIARGNSAAISEVRLMMPSGALKDDEDLASGKLVTDSLGRFPAELNAVVDGDPKTTVEVSGVKPGYSMEIDLGRDRVIGGVEIETTGDIWESFDITFGKTGQKGAEAEPWFKEGAGKLRMIERGKSVNGNKSVLYVATAIRARYLRLVIKSGEKVNLAGIHVKTLQQN